MFVTGGCHARRFVLLCALLPITPSLLAQEPPPLEVATLKINEFAGTVTMQRNETKRDFPVDEVARYGLESQELFVLAQPRSEIQTPPHRIAVIRGIDLSPQSEAQNVP